MRWVHRKGNPEFYRALHSPMLPAIIGIVSIGLASQAWDVMRTGGTPLEYFTVDRMMDDLLHHGWFSKVFFVFAAVPYARSYCQDVAHGFRDALVIKENFFHYAGRRLWMNGIIAFLTSFLGIMLIAFLDSFILDWSYYAKFSEYNYWGTVYDDLAAGNHVILYVTVRSMLFSCGAVLYATVAMAASAIKPEPLLVLAVSFISSYIVERLTLMKLPSFINVAGCINGYTMLRGGILWNLIYGIFLLLFLTVLSGNIFIWLVKRSVRGE